MKPENLSRAVNGRVNGIAATVLFLIAFAAVVTVAQAEKPGKARRGLMDEALSFRSTPARVDTYDPELAVELLKSDVVTSGYARPAAHRVSRGAAQDQQLNLNGTWDVVGDQGRKFVMTLSHSGDNLVGSYQYDNVSGRIHGPLSARVLRFEWYQSNGRKGAGQIEFARNGRTFYGTWSGRLRQRFNP